MLDFLDFAAVARGDQQFHNSIPFHHRHGMVDETVWSSRFSVRGHEHDTHAKA